MLNKVRTSYQGTISALEVDCHNEICILSQLLHRVKRSDYDQAGPEYHWILFGVVVEELEKKLRIIVIILRNLLIHEISEKAEMKIMSFLFRNWNINKFCHSKIVQYFNYNWTCIFFYSLTPKVRFFIRGSTS